MTPNQPSPDEPTMSPPGPDPVTAQRPRWAPVTSRPRDLPATTGQPGPGAAAASSTTPTQPTTDDDKPDPAADRKLFKDKSTTFRTIAETALQATGGLLNAVAGNDTDAFIADDDDMATIPPPIGRIIARRVKVDDDANLSEAADMFAAGIGLVAWLAKGLIKIAESRLAERRAKVVQGTVVDDRAPGEAPGPA